MTSEALQEVLDKELERWTVSEGKLYREYSFKSYVAAAAFVQTLAEEAEGQNHHPDLLLTWRKVSIWLYTHDSNGITELDVKFAKVAEGEYKIK